MKDGGVLVTKASCDDESVEAKFSRDEKET